MFRYRHSEDTLFNPVQGGEDSWDPLSCRSFSTTEPLNIGHFCGKWPIKIRDPMSLRHPVLWHRISKCRHYKLQQLVQQLVLFAFQIPQKNCDSFHKVLSWLIYSISTKSMVDSVRIMTILGGIRNDEFCGNCNNTWWKLQKYIAFPPRVAMKYSTNDGVATMRRLLKSTGLVCRISSLL